jgi:hypothetical protein
MPIAGAPVEDALQELREGKMVILVDDQSEQGEADLCQAAELTTPSSVNFMATHGRGLVCLALTERKLRAGGCRRRSPPPHQGVWRFFEARRGVMVFPLINPRRHHCAARDVGLTMC